MKDEDLHSDFLDGLKKENSFQAPKDYFESFEAKLFDKMENEKLAEQEIPEKKSIMLQLRPYLYMAAMFAGVALILKLGLEFVLTSDKLSTDQTELFSEAVLEQVDMFEYEEIYASLEDVTDEDEWEEDDESLVEYLLTESIDLNTIIEELE